MSDKTIILITLAAIFALGFVFFKYFFGTKKRSHNLYLLATLRFISLFILLVLLINPLIRQNQIEVEKPVLFLAIDQSLSIDYLGQADSLKSYISAIKNDPEINDQFDLEIFGFGNDIQRVNLDSLMFNKSQTDISKALHNLEKINDSRPEAIVLMTDGNQTIGRDFQYFKSGKNSAIYPVVIGDTTLFSDLYISNLNVNKYAFLNNKFPVEVILNYSGNEPVESRFEIRSGNSVMYSRQVNFSSEANSEIINTTLPASSIGTNLYKAELLPISSEKNVINNVKNFGVEVIDERTSVLILSSVAHPDLGMWKKSIESNQQREAEIVYSKNYNSSTLADYQLIILYQPDATFKQIYEDIEKANLNTFLITGSKTDWRFLNSVQENFDKNFTSQSQEVFADYNPNFSQFQFENIGFSSFPPLEATFGILEFKNKNLNPLLFQQLEGVITEIPLLATFDEGTAKKAVLFGENIWKWRLQSYVDSGSFESFDDFTGKLIQYLAGNKKRDRLTFEVEPFYLENEPIEITAQFFDQNYQFDREGELVIELKNSQTGRTVESKMLPDNNRFQFEIDDLEAGDFQFSIQEQKSGITRSGNFSILEYNVEQQFSSANLLKLQALAKNNEKPLNYLNDISGLKEQLLDDNALVSIQKNHQKTVPLINWKILLGLLIFLLGSEWFTRKYLGLI